MDNNIDKKKILIPMIIGITMLITAVAGATYAYFASTSTGEFGNASIHAESEDTKIIFFNGQDIALKISTINMMDVGHDVAYYAQGGESDYPTTDETTINLATITTTGNSTYSCDYSLSVITDDNTNNSYYAFQNMVEKSANQFVLTIVTDSVNTFDFNTQNLFPATITGTFTGLTSQNPLPITGKLKIVNKTGINQTALAGTSILLHIDINDFDCYEG